MGKNEVEVFLSHLATQVKVSASTQRQALNAIVFLYYKVLDIRIEETIEPVKAKRNCFATHMLENGVNIRVVQELMGHANIKTTEIYTHVMEKHIATVCSPLDILQKNVLEEK